MLPAALITLFLIEIGYTVAIGYLMWGDGMMYRLDELSICILIYLVCVRLGLVLASFTAAHLLNPFQPPLSMQRRFRMLLKESAATILAFTVLIPLSFVLAPRLKGSNQPTVVLMVHGFMSNSGIWWWLTWRLRRRGIRGIDSLNLSPVFGTIEQYVRQLDQRVAKLKAQGATNILLVGHSMGGLVCRSWLQEQADESRNDDALQCQLLTLCTPWQGTRITGYLPWKNLAQLAYQNASVLPHSGLPGVPALSLYSAHDNVVIPYTSGQHQCIESSELSGLGHLSVLFETRVLGEIIERCSLLSAASPSRRPLR